MMYQVSFLDHLYRCKNYICCRKKNKAVKKPQRKDSTMNNEKDVQEVKEKKEKINWILVGLTGSIIMAVGMFFGYTYKTAITPPPPVVIETEVVESEESTPPVVVEDNNIIQASEDWIIIEAGLYELTGHLSSPYIQHQNLVGGFKDEKIVLFTEDTIISSSNEAVLRKLDKLPSALPSIVVIIPSVEKTHDGWIIDDNVVDIPKGIYEVHGTLLTPAGRNISSGRQVVQFLYRTTAARSREKYFVFIRKIEDENIIPSLTVGVEEKVVVTEPEKETVVTQAPTPTPTPTPTPPPKPDPKPTPPKTYCEYTCTEESDGFHLRIKNPDGEDKNYQPHGYYEETGPSTKVFILHVPQGWVGIIGGYRVDGVDRGVYKTIGTGTHTHVVTDGFVLLIRKNQAKTEFQFRLDQARQNGWAHDHIDWGPIAH